MAKKEGKHWDKVTSTGTECNDGMQETIISERANRNENQNKECKTIDENKNPRNKRKKVVIKQIGE